MSGQSQQETQGDYYRRKLKEIQDQLGGPNGQHINNYTSADQQRRARDAAIIATGALSAVPDLPDVPLPERDAVEDVIWTIQNDPDFKAKAARASVDTEILLTMFKGVFGVLNRVQQDLTDGINAVLDAVQPRDASSAEPTNQS